MKRPHNGELFSGLVFLNHNSTTLPKSFVVDLK